MSSWPGVWLLAEASPLHTVQKLRLKLQETFVLIRGKTLGVGDESETYHASVLHSDPSHTLVLYWSKLSYPILTSKQSEKVIWSPVLNVKQRAVT